MLTKCLLKLVLMKIGHQNMGELSLKFLNAV